MSPDTSMQRLLDACEPHVAAVEQHPLFDSIQTPEDVRRFMEAHVFAVWDFMSLLTAMQVRTTGCTVPWRPTGDAALRRFVNEIKLEEESDELPDGRVMSHFELYLEAMREGGADTAAIESFVDTIEACTPVPFAVEDLPEPVAEFVRSTFRVIRSGRTHRIAAAFTIGREKTIPGMFRSVVDSMGDRFGTRFDTLRLYLDRHIELDGDKHLPLALRIVSSLCGDDPVRWEEATESAIDALRARCRLWDGVLAAQDAGHAGAARDTLQPT